MGSVVRNLQLDISQYVNTDNTYFKLCLMLNCNGRPHLGLRWPQLSDFKAAIQMQSLPKRHFI